MARSYIADIAGGTATVTIQIQGRQTFKKWAISYLNAAAGKIELSTSPTSQIGTAQPTPDVIARASVSAGANQVITQFDINLPAVAFQNVYIHCTGAGNLGTSVLS